MPYSVVYIHVCLCPALIVKIKQYSGLLDLSGHGLYETHETILRRCSKLVETVPFRNKF